jgi:thiol-disulfide isomerase/thioredoxin
MQTATDTQVGRLARAANMILLAALAVTVTIAAWPRLTAAMGWHRTPAPVYSTGSTIDTPVAWHEQSKFTLVLFARSSCSACRTAQPFLKHLVSNLRGRTAVVLVTTGKEEAADAEYALGLGLDAGAVKVAPEGLRVRATPTLVLVNNRGRVLGSWEGVGSENKQADIAISIDRAIGAGRQQASGGPASPNHE